MVAEMSGWVLKSPLRRLMEKPYVLLGEGAFLERTGASSLPLEVWLVGGFCYP